MAPPSQHPATRQEQGVIKPEGKFPARPASHPKTDYGPGDATGVNPDAMWPIDPDSPYLPPA